MDSRIDQLLSDADALRAEFEQHGQMQYINEAIVLGRKALELCASDDPKRAECLSSLASDLYTEYNEDGSLESIAEAITLNREALALDHPDRSQLLNNLALLSLARYERLGGVDDLNEAVVLAREALSICTPGRLERSLFLNNLSFHLLRRYEQLGGVDDLNEAIDITREALSLYLPDYLDRSTPLNNLSLYLLRRYERLGGVDDLNEAIAFGQEALSLFPPDHPNRSTILGNIASHLLRRYERLGGVDDLNEAIILGRQALSLYTLDHPDRPTSLTNTTLHLLRRYERLGGVDDLNESIVLGREALSLLTSDHPNRPTSLNNLALSLLRQYERFDRVDDLNEAIIFSREALTLYQPSHPDRSTSLINLVLQLFARYERLDSIEDLNEAVDLGWETLTFLPLGHPTRPTCLSNLANFLWGRYERLGDAGDLDQAIILHRDTLSLRPPGHLYRSFSLTRLAKCLSTRYKKDKMDDVEEIFNLYSELAQWSQSVSSADLFAAKEWVQAAEVLHHHTTLLAYKTALHFLVEHLVSLPSLPQHLTLLKSLTSSLAVDAFSACIRTQSPATAIELLEQGRGVFWNQLTRLRSPMDDVVASGPAGKALADEFTCLTSDIRNALSSSGTGQHDRVCQLNFELQGVVSKIRELPCLSRFLLPPLFPDLRCAASGGPVIILNASKYGCDALVVLVDQDPIQVPLKVTRKDVRKLSSKLGDLTALAKRSSITKELGVFLRELWARVVSPIVDALRPVKLLLRSRIWWCPTADFLLLPLHAAGPYKKNMNNFSDLYISSYTSSLSALIRARRPLSSPSPTDGTQFVAIGQANASGESELFSIGTELDTVRECVDGLATFARLEGEESTISRVIEELGRNRWAHLACHGIPNKQEPFESAFALFDGRLSIARIAGCDLEDAEFAYLSACHTTVGDEESPDEVIHLAAAMQFAGFRSVIGTMWAVDDAQANKITSEFYKHMKDKSGRLDHTRAAWALWRATRSVKEPEVTLDQRVLYVHIGA